MIVSIGLALAARYVILFYFGGATEQLPGAQSAEIQLGPISVSPNNLWSLIISAVVILVVGLVLMKTRLGKATRAVADNPALAEQMGHDIVTASGSTLLGADDKSGVAEIVAAVAYLQAHPEIPHGPVKVAFDTTTRRVADPFVSRIEVKAARPTGKISDAFNFLKKKKGPSLSIEEINKIAVRGWAGKR